jgi:hypothetical protein
MDILVGAPEVQEFTFLRDHNKALIELLGELRRKNRRLKRKLDHA